MHLQDTIAAISTPLGEGGLAVVRLSGREALGVADRCFEPRGRRSVKPSAAASHTIQFGRVVHAGRLIDEVLVAVMRAPRTYTREDVVEISCHGGLLPARLVLDATLAAGARPAEPGEFTKRAFLNGRLDLAQAEAVADIIHSRTTLALAAAEEQLAGGLSQRIHRLRDELMATLAHVEAHLDFPDEDLAPDDQAALGSRLDEAVQHLDELLRTAHDGQVLRRGVRAAIVGRPNVGKSSLLNRLLDRDRAIVSPVPGTTRDTIEETADVRGIPVVFVDTAGLRETADAVEGEGVRRSQQALDRSELVLHVLDGSEPLAPEDDRLLKVLGGRKRLLIRNKVDLPVRLCLPERVTPPPVDVSCTNGSGIDRLKDAIQAEVWGGGVGAGMLQVMINSRHQEALQRARAAAARAREALGAGVALDLVSLDLRVATGAVGEVVGQTSVEDLLDAVFARFCIGK